MLIVGPTSLRLVNKAFLLRPITICVARNYYKKPFYYDNRYLGKFDLHDQEKYPRRLGEYKEEELLGDIQAIRMKVIDNPSPFHVITRVRGHSNGPLPWNHQVILRRLNLHSSYNGDVVVVPNTPQYNEMINKVKHLISLKPAVFADGKLPREEDIGALKVCQWTGTVKVDEKLRLRGQRLNLEKPVMFQGNFLRNKLNKMYGSQNNHIMA